MTLPSNMFTRLTVGATFSRATGLFFTRWDVFLAVTALAYLPLVVLSYTLNSAIHDTLLPLFDAIKKDEMDDFEFNFDAFVSGGFLAQLLLEQLFYAVAGILAQATIALAVAELYAGRTPTLTACVKKAASRFCNIFCAGCIVGVGVAAAYVLTIGIVFFCMTADSGFFKLIGFLVVVAVAVAVVYVYVAMMIVAPVIMVEAKSSTKAIQRCWELAAGNRCFIYCTVFALGVVNFLFNVTVMTSLFGGNPELQYTIYGTFVSTFSFLALFPLVSITITVVYLKIRIDQEGLNCDVLVRDLGAAAGDTVHYSSLEIDDPKEGKSPLMTTV